jgi:hypothetical protein
MAALSALGITVAHLEALTASSARAARQEAERRAGTEPGSLEDVRKVFESIAARGLLSPYHIGREVSSSFTSFTERPALCVNVLNLCRPGYDKVGAISKGILRDLSSEEGLRRLLALGLGMEHPSVGEILDIRGERKPLKELLKYTQALMSESSTGIHSVSVERSYAFPWATKTKPAGDESVLNKELLRRVQQSVVFLFDPTSVVVDDEHTGLKLISMLDATGTWPSHMEVRACKGCIAPDKIFKVLVPLEFLPIARAFFREDQVLAVWEDPIKVTIVDYDGMFNPPLKDHGSHEKELVAPNYAKAIAEFILRTGDCKLLGVHAARIDYENQQVTILLEPQAGDIEARIASILRPSEISYSLEAKTSGVVLKIKRSDLNKVIGKKSASEDLCVLEALGLSRVRVSFSRDRLELLEQLQARDDLVLIRVRSEPNTFEVILTSSKQELFFSWYAAKKIPGSEALIGGGAGAFSST